jgi:hypothetical protein
MALSDLGPCAHNQPRTDQECWVRLRAFIATRPRLDQIVPPTDPVALWAARRWMTHTVCAVTEFANTLNQRVAREEPPASGSARAVALSVVRLCWAFTRNWADAARATRSRVIEYNRDVDLLRSALDNLTSAQ